MRQRLVAILVADVAGYSRLMAAYPGLTVTKFRESMVFSPATLDRMSANMKKAGLPD